MPRSPRKLNFIAFVFLQSSRNKANYWSRPSFYNESFLELNCHIFLEVSTNTKSICRGTHGHFLDTHIVWQFTSEVYVCRPGCCRWLTLSWGCWFVLLRVNVDTQLTLDWGETEARECRVFRALASSRHPAPGPPVPSPSLSLGPGSDPGVD